MAAQEPVSSKTPALVWPSIDPATATPNGYEYSIAIPAEPPDDLD